VLAIKEINRGLIFRLDSLTNLVGVYHDQAEARGSDGKLVRFTMSTTLLQGCTCLTFNNKERQRTLPHLHFLHLARRAFGESHIQDSTVRSHDP
jgi:hypothetical protein